MTGIPVTFWVKFEEAETQEAWEDPVAGVSAVLMLGEHEITRAAPVGLYYGDANELALQQLVEKLRNNL